MFMGLEIGIPTEVFSSVGVWLLLARRQRVEPKQGIGGVHASLRVLKDCNGWVIITGSFTGACANDFFEFFNQFGFHGVLTPMFGYSCRLLPYLVSMITAGKLVIGKMDQLVRGFCWAVVQGMQFRRLHAYHPRPPRQRDG